MVALSSHYHYHHYNHHYQHHYHQNRHHHHPRRHHHHLQHDWWLGGGTTALIALIPLFIIAFLLYSGWSRLKQVAIAKIMAIIGKKATIYRQPSFLASSTQAPNCYFRCSAFDWK